MAKTINIERGVVTIAEGGRISIGPGGQQITGKVSDAKTTISKEHYCEQLEVNFPGSTTTLNAFLPHSFLAQGDDELEVNLTLREQPTPGKAITTLPVAFSTTGNYILGRLFAGGHSYIVAGMANLRCTSC